MSKAAISTGQTGAGREQAGILLAQIACGIAFLALWECSGRFLGNAWTSMPSLILVRLAQLAAGDLWFHVLTTVSEMAIGLFVGGSAGVVVGLVLGRSRVAAVVLRPFIVALYSVPLVTMAPLLILWFGLDMTPKIVLVLVVVFFLVFFTTFAGVRTIDKDFLTSFRLMGSTPREEFQMVIAPASMAWIISGVKVAMPYALVAATTGELLAARSGLSFLLARAAAQFDMTGLYSALLLLMILGILGNELASTVERRALRWRHAAQ